VEELRIGRTLSVTIEGRAFRINVPGASEPLDLDHAAMLATVLSYLVQRLRSGQDPFPDPEREPGIVVTLPDPSPDRA
jgi:hypothetical protein